MKRIISILLAVLMLIFASGCSGKAEDGDKKIAAVSIVPQQTFAKAVAGDLWDVHVVIPKGSSPENYEPTPGDRMLLEDADVYFTVGVFSEETAIIPSVGGDTKVVRLEEAVSAAYRDGTIAGGRDPHIWLSPKRVIVMVEKMAQSFGELDPENAETYTQNAKNYISQLQELDEYISVKLDGINNNEFIVFHPAFGYIAEDYGLRMLALEQDGREATPKHMQEMTDFALKNGIKTVFYQAETDSRQAEAFAEAIGGKTICLEPLSENYIENLKGMADLMAETMK